MSTRDALVWMWLGGILSYTIVVLDHADMRQNFARVKHRHGRLAAISTYVTATLLALLWPVMLTVRLVLGGWVYRLMSRDRTTLDTHCSVCGFRGELEQPKHNHNWASLPTGWFVNQQLEVTCSIHCALHHDRCPAHSTTHLH